MNVIVRKAIGGGLLFVVWNKATSIIMTTVVIILETEKMVLQGI